MSLTWEFIKVSLMGIWILGILAIGLRVNLAQIQFIATLHSPAALGRESMRLRPFRAD